MPHRCVVGASSNVRSLENGIALHMIPFYGEEMKKEMDRVCETETCSVGANEEFCDMLEAFQGR